MTRSTRFALLAGATLAALTLAGCQEGGDSLAGPPSMRLAHPGTASVPTPGTIAPQSSASLQFTDSYGHVYAVNLSGDGSSTHSLDGAVYEQISPLNGGSDAVFISDGTVVMEQFMASAAPSGLPSAFEPERPLLHGRGRPQQMQLIPCADQIGVYIAASGALVAAGFGLRTNPGARTTMIFTGALTAWWKAWNSLYECENAIGLSTAPVTPR